MLILPITVAILIISLVYNLCYAEDRDEDLKVTLKRMMVLLFFFVIVLVAEALLLDS